MPRLLVVDDERAILELVTYHLTREGYQVETAEDGRLAVDRVIKESFDLVILDVMLPGLSGLEACRAIRQSSDVPIIMLTARKDELDRVLGLELGADDYVTKPFSPRELTARVKAILRRSAKGRDDSGDVRLPGLSVDVERRTVEVDGQPVNLTFTEFELLTILARHPGRAFTRDELLVRVWGDDFFGDSRTVDVHVRHLREKLHEDPQKPRFIETVRGVGYRFAQA